MHFHCPLDGQALTANDRTLRCPRGHSFDLAKEGYWNLLLVQQKASLDPGDNKEMVDARRRFLAAGHFAPIAHKLADWARGLAPETEQPKILDAGCGEGYFLSALKQAMPGADLAGIDISKWAIKAAAKNHKNIAWAVASTKQLPFAKQSLDATLCLFGFPFWESFRSTLAEGGHVLLVDPAPDHLLELRELAYDTVKATNLSSIESALASGFGLVKESPLAFPIRLEKNAAIQDLLAMTPHGHRITAAARERIASQQGLTTKASVVFRLLRAPQARV